MRRRDFIKIISGSAAAWPLAASAQQPAMPMVGFMSARSPEDSVAVLAAFRRGLGEGSLIEGKNVEVQFRWAGGDFSRLPALAAELVNQRVAVLVAVGGEPSALAAKAATSTIPIVFASTDPVKAGLVASLNRPGGNATGVYILTTEVEAKRLSLLRDLVPGAAMFGVLVNPKYPRAAQQAQELAEAARKVGQSLVFANASTDAELDAAFATLTRQHVMAMLVMGDPFFDTRRDRIVAFAAQQKLPAIYEFREYAVAGGLMSYGPSFPEAYHQVGIYAARILSGAKPADLPVMQSDKFEFVINLKVAKTLGVTFSGNLLSLADEVIE
jgi:putative tryptophan/tyrosine transport system substrate-binding protein